MLQRKTFYRPQTSLRGDKSSQRIGSRVQSFADEYGAEDMAAGFLKSFVAHAYDSLNQQLKDSPLPGFIQDELHDTVKDNCTLSKITINASCQIDADSLCKYRSRTAIVYRYRLSFD